MQRTVLATLALAALALAQVDYQFTMQFTGSCEADPSGATAYCLAKGPSQTMRSLISTDDAVEFDVTTVIGACKLALHRGLATQPRDLHHTPTHPHARPGWPADATIENDVVFYPNMTFSETGNLTFGIHQSRDHTIYYSSFGASGMATRIIPSSPALMPWHGSPPHRGWRPWQAACSTLWRWAASLPSP
jgi:hypothetical protein